MTVFQRLWKKIRLHVRVVFEIQGKCLNPIFLCKIKYFVQKGQNKNAVS